jgi:hypothetical protein
MPAKKDNLKKNKISASATGISTSYIDALDNSGRAVLIVPYQQLKWNVNTHPADFLSPDFRAVSMEFLCDPSAHGRIDPRPYLCKGGPTPEPTKKPPFYRFL